MENELHWVLDTAFGEDSNRTAAGHAGANLGLIRRVAVSLLRQDPGKGSIKAGRLNTALDDDYMARTLQGFAADRMRRPWTFYVTEKLDCTSFTVFIRRGEFGICSRNLWMDEAEESNVLVRVAKGLGLEEKLRAARERLGFDVAVQAEVIGPGIQKNKYALPSATLRVFGVLSVDNYRLLDHADSLAVLSEMQLDSVPQLGTLTLGHSVDQLVAFAEGTSVLSPKVQWEGVVLRPLSEEYDEEIGGRLSFKAINPKFVLKYDE